MFTIQSLHRGVRHARAVGCARVKRGLLMGLVAEHRHDLVRGASGLRQTGRGGLPETVKSTMLEAGRVAPFPEAIR